MARKTTSRKYKTGSRRSGGKVPTAPQLDGGACALAGYTYQMLASGALGVQLRTLGTQPASEAVLLLEQHGQDAKAPGVPPRLIQFKYSETRKPITPRDLAEMLRALDRSSKEISPPTAAEWQLVDAGVCGALAPRKRQCSRRPNEQAKGAIGGRVWCASS